MKKLIWEILEEICLSKKIIAGLPMKNKSKVPEKLTLT